MIDRKRLTHEVLCILEPAYLKHIQGGHYHRSPGLAMIGSRLPGPGFNFVSCLEADSPSLDELLKVALPFYQDAKEGWGVLVEGGAGHPMETKLIARGWKVAEDEPAYLMESLSHIEPVNASLTIRRISDETDLGSFNEITGIAFGAPKEVMDLFAPTVGQVRDPLIGFYIASFEGKDVTSICYHQTGQTAIISGTATLPELRGRGFGEAILRHCLIETRNRGCKHAVLRSGPLSRPLYERVGFQYICQHRTYQYPG